MSEPNCEVVEGDFPHGYFSVSTLNKNALITSRPDSGFCSCPGITDVSNTQVPEYLQSIAATILDGSCHSRQYLELSTGYGYQISNLNENDPDDVDLADTMLVRNFVEIKPSRSQLEVNIPECGSVRSTFRPLELNRSNELISSDDISIARAPLLNCEEVEIRNQATSACRNLHASTPDQACTGFNSRPSAFLRGAHGHASNHINIQSRSCQSEQKTVQLHHLSRNSYIFRPRSEPLNASSLEEVDENTDEELEGGEQNGGGILSWNYHHPGAFANQPLKANHRPSVAMPTRPIQSARASCMPDVIPLNDTLNESPAFRALRFRCSSAPLTELALFQASETVGLGAFRRDVVRRRHSLNQDGLSRLARRMADIGDSLERDQTERRRRSWGMQLAEYASLALSSNSTIEDIGRTASRSISWLSASMANLVSIRLPFLQRFLNSSGTRYRMNSTNLPQASVALPRPRTLSENSAPYRSRNNICMNSSLTLPTASYSRLSLPLVDPSRPNPNQAITPRFSKHAI